MEKLVNYRIISELKLILECAKGSSKTENVKALKIRQIADKEYNPNFNLIIDFRESDIDFKSLNILKLKEFFDFAKNTKGVLGERRTAVLTSSPEQAVLSSLLKEVGNKLTTNFEIFSSLEAALNYLDISLEQFKYIDSTLNSLSSDTSL
jgi:hypothetical protein